MPIDLQRLQGVFQAVADLPPSERPAALERECGGDAEMRRHVEALLMAHDDPGELPAAVPESTAAYVPPAEPGQVFAGRYKLREKLGEGGMGVVFVADQTEPVQRRVALKIIRAGLDTQRLLARFEQEQQALALMDHPNIAKVFDAGIDPAQRPYFAMELVKGLPLTRYCDHARLSPRERLELFIPVCQAVQHAHQKGIIHRDLKPSNILVGLYDGQPVPKVIDFGVAKATGPRLTEQSIYTEVGSIIGTLEYMSPEQAELNNLDIDTRSDIYALGVILYELLTGAVPFNRKELEKAGLAEMLRVIKEREPPRPSTRLSQSGMLPSIAAQRQTEPHKLTALVRGELDWIVMKALDKDRNRRYETANGFALDVQRHLSGEPVLAVPPSTLYRVRKFLRRHRHPVLAAGLVLLALVGGVAGTTWGIIQANAARRAAVAAAVAEQQARTEAEARAEAEARQRRRADDEKARAVRFRDQALAALRAATGPDVEKLLGAKKELSANERAYLEAIARRWQAFAEQTGDDEESRALQAEGKFHLADLWTLLGRLDQAQASDRAAANLYQALADRFPANDQYRSHLASTRNNLGQVLAELGRRDEALAEYTAARAIEAEIVKRQPQNVPALASAAGTLNNLGNLEAELGRRDDALAAFQSAAALLKRAIDHRPDAPEHRWRLSSVRNNLGNLLRSLGRADEARRELQGARDLQRELAERFPTVPEYGEALSGTQSNLAALLVAIGRADEALAECRASINRRRKLLKEFPAMPAHREGLAKARYNRGVILANMGRERDALPDYQAARDLRLKLVAEFPFIPAYRHNLAETRNNLGNALHGVGDPKAARAELNAAITLWTALVDEFPSVPDHRRGLADAQANLGRLLKELGKPEEARTAYMAALAQQEALATKTPDEPAVLQDLARWHNALGTVYTKLGRRDDERREFDVARTLQERLVERFPKEPAYRTDLAGTLCNTAMLIRDLGQPKASLPLFGRAIALLESVLRERPTDALAADYLRNSVWGRAKAFDGMGNMRAAAADWGRVIALSPAQERPGMHLTQARLRHRAGDAAGAVADAAAALALDRWHPDEWYDFACVYAVASREVPAKSAAYADRAVELLRKAIAAGFKDAAHMAKDTDLDPLRGRADFKKLLVELTAGAPTRKKR